MNHVWSYSSLECFNQCPKKFYHKYILKEKEPESDAMRHGNAVHKSLENYIKCVGEIDIPLIEKYLPLADAVARATKDKKKYTELKMGVTAALEPCGFFAQEVYGRYAADVVIIDGANAFLPDWKTGKLREKRDQLAIGALFTFKHFPRVQKVTACNVWLEAGKFGEMYVFERSGEAGGWLALLEQVKRVERTIEQNFFGMIPGPLCGWCPVKSCVNNRS